jgi:hypothetical protein
MDTQSWPWELASRCLKTPRQRKRAQKKHYQKKLIQLYYQREELAEQKRTQPMVPLEQPYQPGWKRSFMLREDVARSGNAAFYEELLHKINTLMYAPDKGFKMTRRVKRKRVYVDRPQALRDFHPYQWYSRNCPLSDTERKHFHLQEFMHHKELTHKYVFSEPWRFVLKVEPRIITHHKLVDEVLEQQIGQLDRYIESRNLDPAISRAKQGSCWKWKNYEEKAKYKNPHLNTPLHAVLAQLRD